MFVSLVEQAVYRYPSKEMEGWRAYRIEYGGHAKSCVYEGFIWLPPEVDCEEIEKIINRDSMKNIEEEDGK